MAPRRRRRATTPGSTGPHFQRIHVVASRSLPPPPTGATRTSSARSRTERLKTCVSNGILARTGEHRCATALDRNLIAEFVRNSRRRSARHASPSTFWHCNVERTGARVSDVPRWIPTSSRTVILQWGDRANRSNTSPEAERGTERSACDYERVSSGDRPIRSADSERVRWRDGLVDIESSTAGSHFSSLPVRRREAHRCPPTRHLLSIATNGSPSSLS